MVQPTNPQWYEELMGEPLKERNFTDTLAARIKERATQTPKFAWMRSRVAAAGLAAAVVASGAIFYTGLSDSQSHKIIDASGTGTISSAIGTSDGPIRVKFGSGSTEAEAYDEKNRRNLTWIQPDDHAKFQFWTIRYEDGSYKFGGDYYVKVGSAKDWQRQGSSTFTEVAGESRLNNLGLFSHAFGHDQFTVLAGQLTDDAIASAYLTNTNDERTDASIAQNADGRFWVAIVKGRPSDFTLQMIDREGRPVGEPLR